MEFGANIGMNIRSIDKILVNAKFSAVEINKKACDQLKNHIDGNLYNCSILDYHPKEQYDFVFAKGVLIHINPNELDSVYQKLYDTSSKYICVAEFYKRPEHYNHVCSYDFVSERLEDGKKVKLDNV